MCALAVAKLWSVDDPEYLGTAFAVSKYLVATAFHVIGNAQTGEVVHRTVKLAWGGGDLISRAEFCAGDAVLDYALLEMRPSMLDSYGLEVLGVARHPPLNHEFIAMGFPASLDSVVKMPSIHGIVGSYDARILGDVPAIQLYCEEAAAGRLRLPGFSGAPVVVAGNLAMALIRWNPPSPDGSGLSQGGYVFATSLISVVEERPLFFRDVRVAALQWGGIWW